MKKFRIIISCLLAIVMFAASIVPAFAEESNLKRQLEREIIKVFYEYYHLIGAVQFYSEDSYVRLQMAYSNANNVLDDENSTDNDYLLAYNDLVNTEEKMYVAPKWAQEEYDLCIAETNEDHWYSEDVWNNYITELSAFKSALNSENEEIIDEYYFKLQSIYNDMCTNYTLIGDIDKSGEVDIKDVSLLQMYLAGRKTFTGGQIYVSSVNCYADNITIKCATDLQLYLAKFKEAPTTIGFGGINLIINPLHDLYGNARRIKRNITEK